MQQYALITGASKGIGYALAEELAKRGNNVLLIARNGQLLQQATNKLSEQYKIAADYLAIDLTGNDAAKKIVDWALQKQYNINILINNAGYGLSGALENYPLTEHKNMMQLNMTVPLELSYLLLPQLKRQNAAYIMNIASGAAYQAVPGLNVYAASKAFILSFSRGLRYELRNSNVSVTAVCPGATETDFPNRAKVTGAKAQKMAARFNMHPQEVAAIAVKGMYAHKAEVVTGFVNKLAVFFAWLLPKSLLEKSAAGIYDL